MSKKNCFVIMPISDSKSGSAKDWTEIFNNLIKPVVLKAGLNCKRSTATTGNILKDIIQDLHKSDVVIADLTDQNSNVFYELGVRHALRDGTIMITQDRKFSSIFDLTNYASHVYDCKSEEGKKELKRKLADLIKEVIKNPTKEDNPVSDFIRRKPVFRGASKEELEGIIEFDRNDEPHIVTSKKLTLKETIGLILIANTHKGISFGTMMKQLAKNGKKLTSSKITGTLATMKGWFIKEGTRGNYVYYLSGTGRKNVLEIIKNLKEF